MSYINGSLKHGAMSEANEGSLHREGLDKSLMGANSGEFKQTQDSKSVSANQTGALGTIMAASKYTP